MPRYDFICDNCEDEYEMQLSIKDERREFTHPEAICTDGELCQLRKSGRVYKVDFMFNNKVSEIKNMPTKAGGERALKKYLAEIQQVMSEPVSNEEVQAGNELMTQKEKERGYSEGHLTGKRPTEMVEMSADQSAVVDRGALYNQLSVAYKEKTNTSLDPNKLQEIGDDIIKERVGKTVVVEKTKKQGPEVLKERAAAAKRSRPRTM